MLLAMIVAAAAPQAGSVKPVCQNAPPTLVKETQRGRARPLTSEPPAQQYFTVLRTENGCQKPVLVSEERRAQRAR